MHTFNPLNSSSFNSTQTNISVQYNTGYANGKIVEDLTSFDSNSPQVIIKWLLANDCQAKVADGVLGLGKDYNHSGNDDIDVNFSLMYALMKNNITSKNIFSQYYTDETATAAKLYVGDIHPNFLNASDGNSANACGVIPGTKE